MENESSSFTHNSGADPSPTLARQSSGPLQRGIYSEVLRVRSSKTTETLKTDSCLDNRHSPASPRLPVGNFRSVPFASTRLEWVPEKSCDVANIKPKVLVAYRSKPSEPPRKVSVERKTRLYASLEIGKLLAERGIDCRDAFFGSDRWLPLESFDDTTYDDRSAGEWISLGHGADGTFRPLAAECLSQDGDAGARWRQCHVVGYDTQLEQFRVRMTEDSSEIVVPRLRLLFKAEDPEKFADRIVAARLSRRYAESLIQYNYYIDNMPTTDATGIAADQMKRLTDDAKLVASKRHKHLSLSTMDALLFELHLLFARTMNKIAFDKRMYNRGYEPTYQELVLPPRLLGLPPKSNGLDEIPARDFSATLSAFCFSSLLVKHEVTSTLVDIRTECNAILGRQIYCTTVCKAMKLEEFKQIQRSHISQLSFDLQDTWGQNIHRIVTQHLSNVGKGWFNMYETSKETYDYGKLKKLLTVAGFLMQDSLRYLTMDSLEAFTANIEAYRPDFLNVCSVSQLKDVENLQTYYDLRRIGSREDVGAAGLFALDIIRGSGDSEFQFNVAPDLFLKAVLDIFEKGLLQMGEISQPEKLILPHLFKSQPKHVLASVGLEEICVQEYRTRLTCAIEVYFPHLEHLLKLFEEFSYILKMKPEEETQQLERRAIGPSATTHLKHAINDYRERTDALETFIPNYIIIGVFRVNCLEIKKHLAHKLQVVANLILDILATRFRDLSTQTLDQYRGVFAALKKSPRNIEELTDLKAFVGDIPSTLERLTSETKIAIHAFEALEHLGYKLYAEDHALRWKLYGCPSETVSLVAEIENAIEKDRLLFLEDMLVQQAEFAESLRELETQVAAIFHYDDMTQLEEINSKVLTVSERLDASVKLARLYNNRELLFGTTVTDYSRVQRLAKEFEPIANLWSTASAWFKQKVQLLEGPFDKIAAQSLERQVLGGIQLMHKVTRAVKDKHLDRIQSRAVALLGELEEFSPLIPVIVALRHEGMRTRHWDKISTAVGKKVWPGMEAFTLNKLLALQITQFADLIVETGELAAREFLIEKALKKMKNEWQAITFNLDEKYKMTNTYVLKGTDEVLALLDEHIVLTQTLQFSPDRKPFEEEIEDWYRKLLLASETLDEWLKCQRSWIYLQAVFDSPDIIKQLASETKRFRTVDRGWRLLMRHTLECPLALALCSTPGLLDKLRDYNTNLEKAQHGLESYLDVKRTQFGRFYFLSNDELLRILSETKDPRRIQPYLCRVFENVDRLLFEDMTTATAIYSTEGEKLLLARPLSTQDKHVESWMGDLEHLIRKSVRGALLHAIATSAHVERAQWILQHPGQCILCGDQIRWTTNVETAIKTGKLQAYAEKLHGQLLQLVALMRSRLDAPQSITLGALIVIDVHSKDVVERLRDEQVDSVTAFEWSSQMRYYWRDDGCCVQCVHTDFPYGYEYLGNTPRLVVTPLTDMAYMTLMGAQLLKLGGALTGPAGTGKTETTKDLAKAVARQCIVFNCSDTMDYLMLGKFFKGLASSGTWCCFDEFNRINIEVLSVVAQHLLILFGAKAQAQSFVGTAETEFEGSKITVLPVFNVFITMNPGYPGRSELPDNLKSLFRPMAMMIPDYALIGEIMLYSFGFDHARLLSRKMVATFKLASEQLAACNHYDYGMRAVRSVIHAAGLLKRAQPQMDEQRLLLRALRDVSVPKFRANDLVLFNYIIEDLFPGVKCTPADHKLLADAFRQAAIERGLQATPAFLDKAMQLYNTGQVRHGLMVIGPTGGGKTSCLRTLAAAVSGLHNKSHTVHLHTLNPKALTIGQLYGHFNELTHEWTDGVVAVLLRQAVNDMSDDEHWILFDGPVDALWIESMNSVLDDNRKLCLNSGEIILLTPRIRVMFEAEDLSVASPATVSRCGMVYMEPQTLGLDVLVTSWLDTLPCTFEKQHLERLRNLLCLLPDATKFVREHAKEIIRAPEITLWMSCLHLLDCMLAPFCPDKNVTPSQELLGTLETKLLPVFLFSLTWSVGAIIDAGSRPHFSRWLLQQVEGKTSQSCFTLPESVDLFGVFFDTRDSGTWMRWAELDGGIDNYSIPTGVPYESIAVPTVDSQRFTYILKLLLSQQNHVLCSGPHGSGKSVNISQYLYKKAPQHVDTIAFAFSAHTQVNQIQALIESRLEKRRRGALGPPAGKRVVIFIDDFNMPRKEEFGAQPPLELLRQWLDHKGWYDRKTSSFVEINYSGTVAAIGPAPGGCAGFSDRLLRHFNLLVHDNMEDRSVYTIFSALLRHFFGRFSKELKEALDCIVQCSIDVYNEVSQTFLPTPSRLHYVFNLRDLWKAVQGMTFLNYKEELTTRELAACWLHEWMRVFGDRLVEDEKRCWLQELLQSHIKNMFGFSWSQICPIARLIFSDFCGSGDKRLYEQVLDLQHCKRTIEDYLEEYNSVHPTTLNVVLFFDACEHITRICRILRQPLGHALLLGVRGSGRQSLSRLACIIMNCDILQIESTKSYGMQEWREDLKTCLQQCGLQEKRKTILVEDAQLALGHMLEDICSVISYGDLPQLYKKEQLEEIFTVCKHLCKPQGITPTRTNIFNEYLKRVQANVHVILVLTPMTKQFQSRLRQYPALTTCCTIDWFSEWPADALKSVAQAQLAKAHLSAPDGKAVVEVLQYMHTSGQNASRKLHTELRRQVFVTPTTFLDLISAFVSIQKSKQLELATTTRRLQIGLEKLEEAARQVETMQQQLHDWQPVLISTSQEIESKMAQIQQDRALADETKLYIEREESQAHEKAASTQALKDEAQRDLDEALPALDQAVECLKKLKAEHVREIKALSKPPAGVLLTMEAVCIMFQVPPVRKSDPSRPGSKVEDFWESAQHRLLKDPKKLLDDLLNYDKENIPEAVISKIEPYMDRQDFDPVAIRKASVACEAICAWVRAMLKYYTVTKAVEPKRDKLRHAEDDLLLTMQNLHATKERLHAAENKIARLADEFAAATKKKEQLSAAVRLCQIKVNRAKPLLSGLENEKLRWGEQAELSRRMQEFMPGHALLSAAMVAYGGPFPAPYRAELHSAWLSKLDSVFIPHASDCTLRQFLGCPVKIRQWNLAGLPKDDFSVENGIILDRSRRWPLMIDPQMQATRFIKALGRTIEQGFEVCKMTDDNFFREIELAIHFGKWMLVENVTDTLDSFLEPILLQPVLKENQRNTVRLGNNVVPWSPNFKLFLTTANPNQNFSPETFVKLTVLNFSITPEGLEEQLLALIVAREAPELEERKNLFVTNNARMRRELKGLEERILQLLSQSEGDLLEDEALVGTLAAAKLTAEEMNKKVQEAEATELEIDKARECYRVVATRASLLFFCVADLANLQFMYQYSLQWFQGLITAGIDEAVVSNQESGTRLEVLKEHLTYLVYENVSRALFGKHQLLFSFSLALKIQARYSVDPQELRFFLTGAAGKNSGQHGSFQSPVKWLSDKQWADIQALSQLQAFSALDQSIRSRSHEFKTVFDAENPHTLLFPRGWDHLTPIQRMCVIRILRSDKIVDTVRNFVTAELGRRYIENPTFDMTRFYKSSTSLTPLIFIISPGYDPYKDLSAFAKDVGMGRRLRSLALGQGQGSKARKLVEDGCSRGGWVLLQNCHVASSWMSELERLCERFSQEEVHRDFRLWLSSRPFQSFPAPVLQTGVKIISEPPEGLRANLLRLYASQDERALDGAKQSDVYRKLCFAFCFFHAIVQDRKRFGPIGWNAEYEFTVDDLTVCQRQLAIILDTYGVIPYQVLVFLGAKINYGGRVTDNFDKRLLECIIKSYINPHLVEQGANFKFSSSGLYYCPNGNTQSDFVQYIQNLPLNASPEVFGLHENASIKFAQSEGLNLLKQTLYVTYNHRIDAEKTREQAADETVCQISEELPDRFDLEAVLTQYSINYVEPLNTVLIQEVVRYNGLLSIMRQTMSDMRKAIKGEILMTEELDYLASSIFDNVVPRIWSDKGFLSMKTLTSWVQELHARISFIRKWIVEGFPVCFWLSGLFSPQALLTGILQNHARKFGVAIDRLSFAYTLMDDTDESTVRQVPSTGWYICGIFLEGCHWDSEKGTLGPSKPKVLFEHLPVVWLQPVPDREPLAGQIYRCPVYKVPRREGSLLTTGRSTNHVLTLEIPISVEEDVFVKAGVAGVLSLQD